MRMPEIRIRYDQHVVEITAEIHMDNCKLRGTLHSSNVL